MSLLAGRTIWQSLERRGRTRRAAGGGASALPTVIKEKKR
jgi:hypothetical protein